MSEVRRPFPLFNKFRKFVIDEMILRKNMYPQPTSAPFVRMTAATADPVLRYKYFSIGLHGYEPDDTNLFDPIYGKRTDVVGYAHSTEFQDDNGNYKKRLISSDDLTIRLPDVTPAGADAQQLQRMAEKTLRTQIDGVAHGAHPIPGITAVRIDTNNPNMPLIAQVEWKCYNRQQLEFLRHHFMVVNTHVVLEWGNMFSNRVPEKILNFGDPNIDTILADIMYEGRTKVYKDWIEPNNGNYDFIVGFIGNFQVDLDARQNIYTCTSTIYTTGEQLQGFLIHQTHVTTTTDQQKNAGKVANIADFFKIGGPFDAILNKPENRDKIAILTTDFKAGLINSTTDLAQGQSNPNDLVFVTWEFFANIIIKEMFAMLDNPDIRGDLFDIIQYYNDGVDVDRIGDNQWLRSTDASTLVIVRRLNMTNVPSQLTKAGYFDEGGGGEWGDLNRGVWLNISAIRECFLQSYSFNDAVHSLLTRMNRATVNYWQLGVYYDDEKAIYKIVDYKYGDLNNFPVAYRFNVGGVGEVLDIKFESAFPAEMIGMLAMTAKFKSETPERQAQLLKDKPLLGTTAHYAYALNWTNLQDVLQQEIARRRSEKQKPTEILSFTQGLSENQTNLLRDIQRITGASLPDFLNPMKTVTTPEPGKKLGDVVASLNKEYTDKQPTIRNSTTPVVNKTTQNIIERSKEYDTIIDKTAKKYNIDPDFIRAIIAQESAFKPDATRPEPQINDASMGLGQILKRTAAGHPINWKGDMSEVYKPDVNIDMIGKLIQYWQGRTDGSLEAIASAYNGGYRPQYGFGAPAPADVRICVRWSSTDKSVCDEWKMVKAGEWGNKTHIDRVMGYYNTFRATNNLPTSPTTPTLPQQTPTPEREPYDPSVGVTGNTGGVRPPGPYTEKPPEEAGTEEKFGSEMLLVIEQNPSRMLSMITKSGLESTPPHNNFVAPFPTSAKVTLTLLGLSGFSLTDVFTVDKLPFIYDSYGAFQVTRISEQITTSGWVTILQGTFKFLWFDGTGPKDLVW